MSMMKIYEVKNFQGDYYEGYWYSLVYFSSKDSAKKYSEKYNNLLEKLKDFYIVTKENIYDFTDLELEYNMKYINLDCLSKTIVKEIELRD